MIADLGWIEQRQTLKDDYGQIYITTTACCWLYSEELLST